MPGLDPVLSTRPSYEYEREDDDEGVLPRRSPRDSRAQRGSNKFYPPEIRTDYSLDLSEGEPDDPMNRSDQTSAAAPTPSPNSAKANATYLTRKAHQFSSMKKKKNASTLLNRLFCNIPMAASDGPSSESKMMVSILPEVNTMPSDENNSGDSVGSLENAPPGSHIITMVTSNTTSARAKGKLPHSHTKTTSSGKFGPNSWVAPLKAALEEASESLTLHEEGTVRQAIQRSLDDASQSVMEACSGSEAIDTSPPTIRFKESGEGVNETENNSEADSTAAVKDKDELNRKQLKKDSTEKSSFFLNPFLTSPLRSPPPPPPQRVKPMKTPGGLVIPSPFANANGAKSLFPSTLDRVYVKPSVEKSPPRPDKTEDEKLAVEKPEAPQLPTIPENAVSEPPKPLPATPPRTVSAFSPCNFVRMMPSNEELPVVLEASSSKETASVPSHALNTLSTVDDGDDAFLPEDFEAELQGHDRRFSVKELEERLAEAIKIAKEEWGNSMGLVNIDSRDELGESAKVNSAVEDCTKEAQHLLKKRSIQWKHEHEAEIRVITAKYERKLNEQKDQTALANRLARTRQEEMERMELLMEKVRMHAQAEKQNAEERYKALKMQQDEENKRLQIQLSQLQAAAHGSPTKPTASPRRSSSAHIVDTIALERLESELRMVQSQLAVAERKARADTQRFQAELKLVSDQLAMKEKEVLEALKQAEKLQPEMKHVQDELTQVRAQLVAKQSELNAAHMKLSQLEPEMDRLQNALIAVKEKVATQGKEMAGTLASTAATAEVEIAKFRDELEKTKALLAAKDKELANLSKNLSTPNRRASTGNSPAKSQNRLPKAAARSPPRPGSAGKASKELDPEVDSDKELHEREKENLKRQIALLEEQAMKARDEHDRALRELRLASEGEIINVKRDLEQRLEQHMEKERELKETLSNVASLDKEELLEQIERLEAEKKAERSGGLREVQKKEDLLNRIASLEKKEKDMLAEHVRAMQDLREQSDAEIKRLHEQMERQRELREARERELEQVMSETSSFEKEELKEKVEFLEAKLEGERSGAVLVKMKLAAMEKEAKAAEAEHEKALLALKSETSNELKRLREQVENLRPFENSFKEASAENGILKNQLNDFRNQLERVKSDSLRQLDDLRRSHVDELDRTLNEGKSLLEKAQQEHQSLLESLQKQISESSETLRKEYEGKIHELKNELDNSKANHNEALRNEYEGQIQQLRRESEESKTTSILELSQEYEKRQKESEVRVHSLQLELEEKNKIFEKERGALEQKATEEQQSLRHQLNNLRAVVEEEKNKYESRIVELEEGRSKELEELIAQLDLVEEEHKDKLREVEQMLADKDGQLVSLKQQLVEAHTSLDMVKEANKKLEDEVKRSHQTVQERKAEVDGLRTDLKKIEDTFKKYREGAEKEKETACEQARDEMIARAESQFKQANEMYIKLKKQCDAAKSKADRLEGELKSALEKIEILTREKEEREVDLNAELAQLRASQAKIEADAAQKTKDYRKELERLLRTAKDFEIKVEEAESARKVVEAGLSAALADKERLQREYDEVKSVCEELMAMVEGEQQAQLAL